MLPYEIIPQEITHATNNYSYFPIILKDEIQCIAVRDALIANGITPRRYFYPPLDTLAYTGQQICPISREIARSILCLPMYESLLFSDVSFISNLINVVL